MYARIIETIQEIERQCDTQALLYNGVNYWPLARAKIWAYLTRQLIIQSKDGAASTVSNSGPTWADVGQVNVGGFGPAGSGLLISGKVARQGALTPAALRPKMLFVLRPEEYTERVGGRLFAKMLDSLFERASTQGPATKLELINPKTADLDRRYPSLLLAPEIAGRDVKFDPPGHLGEFADLTAAADASGATGALEAKVMAEDMGKICYYARIFEKTLRLLGPQALVLSVYYYPVGMAWMLACRRAGVTSVDVQHGRLGPHHGMYTQLSSAPTQGYELSPDVIWCWGQQTQHDISVDLNPACTRHRGTVGGNPWLYKWRHSEDPELSPPELTDFADNTSAHRRILVSLQPLDEPLGPTLLSAMKTSPANWLWLVRVHPLRRHTVPEIGRILRDAGITNFEVTLATTLPLFGLLKICDHHVTVFSSVVVEAAAFGLRTSLLGLEGNEIFTPQIQRGVCRFTPSTDSLLTHIAECLQNRRAEIDDDFIDLSSGVVERALSGLTG